MKNAKYEQMVNHVYEKVWPPIRRFMSESLQRFMEEKSVGVFGDFKEEGNGWKRIKNLSERLAELKYSVLTGKSVFKRIRGVVVEFPFFSNLAPHILSIKNYCEWLVSLAPKTIVILGPFRSTATIEELAAYEQKKETYAIAIVDSLDLSDPCTHVEFCSVNDFRYALCNGNIGSCQEEEGKSCPFMLKGSRLGYLDLYMRSNTMNLLAVEKEKALPIIFQHIGFV